MKRARLTASSKASGKIPPWSARPPPVPTATSRPIGARVDPKPTLFPKQPPKPPPYAVKVEQDAGQKGWAFAVRNMGRDEEEEEDAEAEEEAGLHSCCLH